MVKNKQDYDAFDLATYLVASARDCVDEPLIYGPLRLLEGVNKIIMMGEEDPRYHDDFLSKMRARVTTDVLKVMSDREEFKKALDDLLLEFAAEARRRTMGKRGRKSS
ncbi:MAG TPA: DUF6092 family protein [Nitrososphaerales archaeon]|nr:DUF6092 family protein [Nitrososphaerales archaeon]